MSHPSTTWTLTPDPETPGAILARQTSAVVTGVDWAIDLDTGDLIFPLRYTTGLEAVAQGLRIRILSFRGEWFWNLDDGVPYLARNGVTADEALLGQRYDKAKAIAAFRDAILATPGVTEILTLAADFDTATRTLSISFKVRTTFGVVEVDELEI